MYSDLRRVTTMSRQEPIAPSAHAELRDTPIRLLWRATEPERSNVRSALVLTVANKVFDVMPEFLIGFAVDVVVRGEGGLIGQWTGMNDRWRQLLLLAALTVLIWIGESVTDYLAELRWRNLSQSIQHRTRIDLYRHLQQLEQGWFEDRSSGGLLSVLNDDVNQLERFLDVGAHEIVSVTTNVVVVGLVFVFVSPLLALVAFLPIPVIIAASLRYQRRLEPLYADVRDAVGDLSTALTNNLGGIATIRAFVAEDREVDRISALSNRYRTSNGRAIRYSAAFIPLIRMAILAAFVVTLLVGGRSALDGTLAVGLYSSLVYMTQRLLWPLTRLGETLDGYQRAASSVRRMLGVLEYEPGIVSGLTPLTEPVRGRVELRGVTFSYRSGGAVLTRLSLVVPAGETHAIVGTTGAGKSTVLKLLLRLYEVESGAVLVDDNDVRDLSFGSLRRAIGYVAQDTFLFEGTIRENVAYGRPDATDDDIRRALRAAEAVSFVDGLPGGLATLVGERGQKLSGGQRQRLAIARAIVLDPPILILDEATSAVDNETEAAIQRSLETVSRGRTTIVIAHRLSTVRHADRIHVVEAGRVAEAGTHDELVAGGGLYSALWRVQTGERRDGHAV